MTGQAGFYGLYVPWLLLLSVAAAVLLWGARRVLAATGAYRWVWHPALFDTALYVLLLYALNRLAALTQ